MTDEDCLTVFRSAAKKRKDAIEAFRKGGRADRASAEGPKDFGKVIKAAVARAAGRADGKRISAAVSAHLKK